MREMAATLIVLRGAIDRMDQVLHDVGEAVGEVAAEIGRESGEAK